MRPCYSWEARRQSPTIGFTIRYTLSAATICHRANGGTMFQSILRDHTTACLMRFDLVPPREHLARARRAKSDLCVCVRARFGAGGLALGVSLLDYFFRDRRGR